MAEGKGSELSQFGRMLRRLRLTAHLTQEVLAEQSGVSVDGISALESGRRQRPHPSTVEMLADGLGLGGKEREEFVAVGRALRMAVSQEAAPAASPIPRDSAALATLGHGTTAATDSVARLRDAHAIFASMPVDSLPDRAPLPAGSRMPLAPNPLFVGRGDELRQVARALRGGDTPVALGQVVASTGLGGLGKTQVAVELVHRYGRFFAGGVYWLSFASADEVPLQVAACAAPEFEIRPLEERVRLVKDAWQSATPRLLVFDNCEEEALLDEWRPSSGGCRVLVTSRRSQWSPTLDVTVVPLDLLPRVDSIELLRRYRPDLAADDPGLDAIAAELGDLPLALHLAGSYLRAYRAEVSLDGYLAELRQESVVQHASLLGAGIDDAVSPTHHVQGVAQTFALCLGRLDPEREVDRVARSVLARLASMAPGEPVPRDLLAATLADVGPLLRADGARRLAAVGLVEEGVGWLRMHRLVARFVRQEHLDPSVQHEVDRVLIDFADDEDVERNGSDLAQLIPHLIDASRRNARAGNERGEARISNAAGCALMLTGHLRGARPYLERAAAVGQGASEPDHETPMYLNDLAVLYEHQGDVVAARSLMERCLLIGERVLGPLHPTTAVYFHNLGRLLGRQGDLTNAQSLLQRALTIRERVLGPHDYRVARTLTILAQLDLRQGYSFSA